MLDYIAYPPFHCAVTAEPGGRLGLAKLTGSQRQKGMMWADAPRRGVFLGTIELGDERRPIASGADVDRDVEGVVERVGDARWRLARPCTPWAAILVCIALPRAGCRCTLGGALGVVIGRPSCRDRVGQ